MKAALLPAYDAELSLEDVPPPEVQGASDVIVRIGGAGLCRTDLHIIEGIWKEKVDVELPYILGHENAGWVEDVGPGVRSVKPGDAVIVHPVITCGLCRACRAGEDMHCIDLSFPGHHHERRLRRVPAHRRAGDHQAPRRPRAEGDRPLRRRRHHGLPGGQAGRGAAHARHEDRADRRRRPRAHRGAGPRRAVRHRDHRGRPVGRRARARVHARRALPVNGSEVDAVEAVKDLTGGEGADAVIDFVGEGSAIPQAVGMLRKGGTYWVVGYGGRSRCRPST